MNRSFCSSTSLLVCVLGSENCTSKAGLGHRTVPLGVGATISSAQSWASDMPGMLRETQRGRKVKGKRLLKKLILRYWYSKTFQEHEEAWELLLTGLQLKGTVGQQEEAVWPKKPGRTRHLHFSQAGVLSTGTQGLCSITGILLLIPQGGVRKARSTQACSGL